MGRYIAAMAETMPILIYPAPALRQRARPVAEADMRTVAEALPGNVRGHVSGAGDRACRAQVGIGLRFCIVDLMPNETPAPLTLINPELAGASEETATREEGCLSLPDQYAEVTRPARVRVRYRDLDGTARVLEAEGLLAACVQHEMDHLDGVLFVDHLSALKRNMMLRRLAKDLRQKKHE